MKKQKEKNALFSLVSQNDNRALFYCSQHVTLRFAFKVVFICLHLRFNFVCAMRAKFFFFFK